MKLRVHSQQLIETKGSVANVPLTETIIKTTTPPAWFWVELDILDAWGAGKIASQAHRLEASLKLICKC